MRMTTTMLCAARTIVDNFSGRHFAPPKRAFFALPEGKNGPGASARGGEAPKC